VAVQRPIADVVRVHFNQVVLDSALEDGDFEIGLKDFGKEAENVKTHTEIVSDCWDSGKNSAWNGRQVQAVCVLSAITFQKNCLYE